MSAPALQAAHIWLAHPWGLIGTLFTLAFWGLIVFAIVALLRSSGSGSGTGEGSAPALRTLEARYARSEITREDFLERREVLRAVPDRP